MFWIDFIVIRIGDPLKTTTRKFHVGEVKFSSYTVDTKVCPLECLKQYLKLTSTLRGNIKPYKSASKDSLSRWIKNNTYISASGIDTAIFSPHSTRSALTSLEKKNNIRIETILKTGCWRSMHSYAKHYAKIRIFENLGPK